MMEFMLKSDYYMGIRSCRSIFAKFDYGRTNFLKMSVEEL